MDNGSLKGCHEMVSYNRLCEARLLSQTEASVKVPTQIRGQRRDTQAVNVEPFNGFIYSERGFVY